MSEPHVGLLIDGRYELEAVIGRGGMGTVWRALHRYTKVRVALKVLNHDLIVDPEVIQRFLAEARAPSTIGHPAIVEITDANFTPEGLLVIAMELLHGRSLRAAMTGPMAGDEVRRIGLELLDALAAAHARGFVHRDLKPENLFLTAPGGALRLLDFGIAKVLGADSRTMRGRILGTVEYMAPEQLRDAAAVDPRADLFAVGVILYEMIVGLRPFRGETVEEKYRALANDEPVPIGEVAKVGSDVETFFANALAKNPTQRFQNATEMADALRTLGVTAKPSSLATTPTLGSGAQWATPPPPGATAHARSAASPRSRRGLVIALGIAAVALVGGGLAIGLGTSTSSPPIDASSETERPPGPDPSLDLTAGDRCAAICKRLGDCGLAQSSCANDCRTKQMLLHCIDTATTCDQLATCSWKWMCGFPPTGDRVCWNAVKCIEQCAADSRCRCKCVGEMNPKSATLLARVFLCRTDCGDDLKCFADRCQPHVPACFAEQ